MLKIKILAENQDLLKSYYSTDAPKGSLYSSGIDLICPEELTVPAKTLGFKIKLGVACQPDMSREVIPHGYYLYARRLIIFMRMNDGFNLFITKTCSFDNI